MIYLITSNSTYKIGYTKDATTLQARLSAYRTHNPSFYLIGTIKGTRQRETNYHRLYKQYKVNNRSEWLDFSTSPETLHALTREFI